MAVGVTGVGAVVLGLLLWTIFIILAIMTVIISGIVKVATITSNADFLSCSFLNKFLKLF